MGCKSLTKEQVRQFLSELTFVPVPKYQITCVDIQPDLARFSSVKKFYQVTDRSGNIIAQELTFEGAEKIAKEKLNEAR